MEEGESENAGNLRKKDLQRALEPKNPEDNRVDLR